MSPFASRRGGDELLRGVGEVPREGFRGRQGAGREVVSVLVDAQPEATRDVDGHGVRRGIREDDDAGGGIEDGVAIGAVYDLRRGTLRVAGRSGGSYIDDVYVVRLYSREVHRAIVL